MKLMQPGLVSHGQRLPINTSVLNKGPALMVFWKTSSHFNTEKSVSAFFSAWVVCSQFIHFYRTAWEPQICCTLLRNYSACCTTLEGQHEDIYSSALWVCGCVCVCACVWNIYKADVYSEGQGVFSSSWAKFSGMLWENSSIVLSTRHLECSLLDETEVMLAMKYNLVGMTDGSLD